MASEPVYSVSYKGRTTNSYVAVSADAVKRHSQFGEIVEVFKDLGVTVTSFFFRPFGGGARAEFSSGFLGHFEIVSTLGSLIWWTQNEQNFQLCCLNFSPLLFSGTPKVANVIGRGSSAALPGASPASSPLSTPRSDASASSHAKAARDVLLDREKTALVNAFNADSEGKSKTAKLFATLQSGIPDSIRLHRMLTCPSFGTGGHVDMIVDSSGYVTKGGVSTCIHVNTDLADLAHDYMGTLANVKTGTTCCNISAGNARGAGFTCIMDQILIQTDAREPILVHVLLMPRLGTHQDSVSDMLSAITASADVIMCSYVAAAEPVDDVEDDDAPPASPPSWRSLAMPPVLVATAIQHPCMVDPLRASAVSSALKLHLEAAKDGCEDISDHLDLDNEVAAYPASAAHDEVA